MEAQGYSFETINISFCGSNYEKATENSSAIVLMTEFEEFKSYVYSDLVSKMDTKSSFYDLRNYFDMDVARAAGFKNLF